MTAKKTKSKSMVVFGQIEIAAKSELLSLTDMWRAAGEPESKRPNDWLALTSTKEFVDSIANILNAEISGIIKTTRGKGGGTWAHWQIALAYAKTLDHRLHAEVNAVYKAHQEAKTTRQASVAQRNDYTSTIAAHGVRGAGFAECTNAGYKGVYGTDAAGLREKHNLPAKANVRAAMSPVGQAAMILTEALAVDRITATSAYGTPECADATYRSGTFVRDAVIREKNDRQRITL